MINILYASEMGNALDLAFDIESKVKDTGLDVQCNEMDDFTVENLSAMKKVMIICSTTGDGDVPIMGSDFWEELAISKIDLSGVNYSLCALGDSSHFSFCGAGRKIDAKMKELGAKAILPRHECDGDIEGADEWAQKVINKFK